MRKKLFIILCCLISIYTEAKIKDDSDKKSFINNFTIYQGDKLISDKGFAKKIDTSCTITHPYGGTHEEIENERKRCVLSKMTYSYIEIIHEMKLNEIISLPPINGINVFIEKIKQIDTSNTNDENIVELKLFTKINDQINDSLTIYYVKNDYGAFYVESQYYYIDKYIYILKLGSDEDGSIVKFWKKYSINANGKFKLEDSYNCHYENKLDKNICH